MKGTPKDAGKKNGANKWFDVAVERFERGDFLAATRRPW